MSRILLVNILFLFSLSNIAQTKHIVQRGETIELIANRYGISVSKLKEVNPLIEEFYTGLTLSIPPKAKSVESFVEIKKGKEATDKLFEKETAISQTISQPNVVWESSDDEWMFLNIDKNDNPINKQINIVSTSTDDGLNLTPTLFKLQEGKFYNIEEMKMGDYTFPFEAELVLVKFGENYTISVCEGDGNGNAETVELYEAEYLKDNGISIYTLKGKMAQEGETGLLKLKYLSNQNKVYVFYKRTKNGRNYTSELIMDATPYNTSILKKH